MHDLPRYCAKALLPSCLRWYGLILLFLFACSQAVRADGVTFSTVPFLCKVSSFGAVGDGKALETVAIQAAIDECHRQGGGTVVLAPGIYRTGTIYLLDNITLKLEKGATILGSADLADYPRMARASEDRDTALILAENVQNIAIVGEGTIDGNGRAFMLQSQAHFYPYFDPDLTRQGAALVTRMSQVREGPVEMAPRPGVLVLVLHADGVLVRDIHVVDSPNWGVKLMCSNHVTVQGLDVRNSLTIPNNDALDISASSNATVSDSYLEAGDDALVVGGPCADGWCQEITENVTVTNVMLTSRSAAIRVGPAAKDVHNLKFKNVIIRDSNRGVCIEVRSTETIEDISFTNLRIETRLMDGPWWGSGEPISITAAKWAYPSWTLADGLGSIRRVQFLKVKASSQAPMVLFGTEEGHIEGIGFRDLTVTLRAGPLTPLFGGNIDLQPTTPISQGLTAHELSAVVVHNVNGLTLKGLQVRWDGSFPDFYRHAVIAEGFEGLTIDGFRGGASSDGYAAIRLRDGKNVSIRKAKVPSGRRLLDAAEVMNVTGVTSLTK